jgi:hypothetical protein
MDDKLAKKIFYSTEFFKGSIEQDDDNSIENDEDLFTFIKGIIYESFEKQETIVLVRRLYDYDYDFSEEEFKDLIFYLFKYESNKLTELIILHKFFISLGIFTDVIFEDNDGEYVYNSILYLENVYETLFYYNCLDPIKWLIDMEFIKQDEGCFNLMCKNSNLELVEFYLNKYPEINILNHNNEAIKNAILNNKVKIVNHFDGMFEWNSELIKFVLKSGNNDFLKYLNAFIENDDYYENNSDFLKYAIEGKSKEMIQIIFENFDEQDFDLIKDYYFCDIDKINKFLSLDTDLFIFVNTLIPDLIRKVCLKHACLNNNIEVVKLCYKKFIQNTDDRINEYLVSILTYDLKYPLNKTIIDFIDDNVNIDFDLYLMISNDQIEKVKYLYDHNKEKNSLQNISHVITNTRNFEFFKYCYEIYGNNTIISELFLGKFKIKNEDLDLYSLVLKNNFQHVKIYNIRYLNVFKFYERIENNIENVEIINLFENLIYKESIQVGYGQYEEEEQEENEEEEQETLKFIVYLYNNYDIDLYIIKEENDLKSNTSPYSEDRKRTLKNGKIQMFLENHGM